MSGSESNSPGRPPSPGNVDEPPESRELERTPEEVLLEELSLMLMYLESWKEHPESAPRFWKGFSFEVLNQLAEEGLITDSRRAKSAYLTDTGVQKARQLLARYASAVPRERGR